MNSKYFLTPEERLLFQQATQDITPLKQSRRFYPTKPLLSQQALAKKQQREQTATEFYFSDHYQPLLPTDGTMRYCRHDVASSELKKLGRGDYSPELFLDLHGLTQAEAKREIAALLVACQKEHVHCACIMHGHGKHVLKRQTPRWLAQHPDVLAFHQAPKSLGGSAALLLLVALEDPPCYSKKEALARR